MPRLLDLFSGRWGWSRAFAARGWECVGVDLVEPPEIPEGCRFVKYDILELAFSRQPIPHFTSRRLMDPNPLWETTHFDFICASSPCEQFSVHGMKHFHPNPPYPELGIKLFEHTRALCEASGVPYVMENVRDAQKFVGRAAGHCGPYYVWGNGVPPILPQGIRKNMVMGNSQLVNEMKRNGDREGLKAYRRQFDMMWNSSKSPERKAATALAATIPPELANAVATYAERLLEQRAALNFTEV